MHLYNEQYIKCPFFSKQDDAFLSWVCPQFRHLFVPIDQIIFYEGDLLEEIFFLTKGCAGFILPYVHNLCYIEIEVGDAFGHLDILLSAQSNKELGSVITCNQMFENIDRQFTVQAICTVEMLTLPVQAVKRMNYHFHNQLL